MDSKPNQTQQDSVSHLTGPDKRYLTIRQRESLKRSLETSAQIVQATADSYATATEGGSPVLPPGFNVNKARLSQQAKETLEVLQTKSPTPLNQKERDGVAKRLAELEKELKDNDVLETFEELHVTKRSHPAWVTATKKAQKRHQWEAKIQELKNCKLLLEPENDYADSLDYLRRQK